mmetsp:Transcript_50972/g.76227  ORF Transcript_50972/g.76227 Transcript_50972/m.76227 type:complete len:133 (-) Transcript_50972:326-724(-)
MDVLVLKHTFGLLKLLLAGLSTLLHFHRFGASVAALLIIIVKSFVFSIKRWDKNFRRWSPVTNDILSNDEMAFDDPQKRDMLRGASFGGSSCGRSQTSQRSLGQQRSLWNESIADCEPALEVQRFIVNFAKG